MYEIFMEKELFFSVPYFQTKLHDKHWLLTTVLHRAKQDAAAVIKNPSWNPRFCSVAPFKQVVGNSAYCDFS